MSLEKSLITDGVWLVLCHWKKCLVTGEVWLVLVAVRIGILLQNTH